MLEPLKIFRGLGKNEGPDRLRIRIAETYARVDRHSMKLLAFWQGIDDRFR